MTLDQEVQCRSGKRQTRRIYGPEPKSYLDTSNDPQVIDLATLLKMAERQEGAAWRIELPTF